MHSNVARHTIAIAIAASLAAVSAAGAAVVTVTDCVTDPHIVVSIATNSTRIEVGANDLVIQCDLSPAPATQRVVLGGHDITIDVGASVLGTDNSQGVVINATGAFTAIESTIQSTNPNGDMSIDSVGDMTFTKATLTIGDASSAGDAIGIACSGGSPKCKITSTGSTFTARVFLMDAVGDITFASTKVITHGSRDLTRITSTMGNVNLGTAAVPVGDNCCDGDGGGGGDSFLGGSESNMSVLAFGKINLSQTNILIAENICIRSGMSDFSVGACDPCTGGVASAVPADIDVSNASIRNDSGKPGDIRICADETRATIKLDGAILIDDDAGVSTVSTLNGCAIVPRVPPCVNLSGTPDTDS
ncbi:MAG: hypothetical protein HY271_05525 [Deltaproteobacteria bacterium]|nr:hypothetical protein [Deltaproteobacteria bacterium]